MQSVEQKAISTFFRTGHRVEFLKSKLIIGAETKPSGIYFIDSGHVKEYTINDNGEEVVNVIYKQGEVFPFIWAYLGDNSDMYFESLSNVVAWRVTRESLIPFIMENKEVCYALACQLAKQHDLYKDRINNLLIKTSKARVIHRIVFLASRFGVKKGKKICLDVAITHDLIGASVNLSRESVSREMEKLERAGYISRENHLILINDIQALNNELVTPLDLDHYGINLS